MTKFSVRPARLGWVYEFEGGRARGAGWRFTRDAAKRAGQRKAGELADHPVALRPQPTQSTRFGALGSVVDSSPHARAKKAFAQNRARSNRAWSATRLAGEPIGAHAAASSLAPAFW